MELGVFSFSLAVKDIAASWTFYEKLGFQVIDGRIEDRWLVLAHSANPTIKIGLFQGMFEQNILTFNPKDVRSSQKELKQQGVALMLEADENTTGPAHITFADPDGNSILIDQF